MWACKLYLYKARLKYKGGIKEWNGLVNKS